MKSINPLPLTFCTCMFPDDGSRYETTGSGDDLGGQAADPPMASANLSEYQDQLGYYGAEDAEETPGAVPMVYSKRG